MSASIGTEAKVVVHDPGDSWALDIAFGRWEKVHGVGHCGWWDLYQAFKQGWYQAKRSDEEIVQ